jgi:hypothetical protein
MLREKERNVSRPTMRTGKRIGIDFDNTLIDYDQVFRTVARECRLIGPGLVGGKEAVRDAVRQLPDGETEWQRLQGAVYGRGVAAAVMFEGAEAFLRRARAEGHEVLIVSHKTEYANYDPARVNLRAAALDWMEARGFFDPQKHAIPRANVFFEDTRAGKLARIGSLQCTHFIDDLIEVLSDSGFPPTVARVKFGRTTAGDAPRGMTVCPSWREIADELLPERP